MEPISAVIITLNEERNIARCLQSLQGIADEIVVVDSGSTDQTQKICLQHGARLHQHTWENYSAQKNYANTLASHPWILSIDADEALSNTLRESIIHLKTNGLKPNTLYSFNRLTNYCGHWIHHCGWYPDPCTRLFHKETAHWDGIIHETLQHPPNIQRQHLTGDLLHYSYHSVADHLQRMTRYAPLNAQKAYAENKRPTFAGILLRTAWTFARTYLLKRGILDGTAGYTLCRMSALSTFLKYTILRELTKNT